MATKGAIPHLRFESLCAVIVAVLTRWVPALAGVAHDHFIQILRASYWYPIKVRLFNGAKMPARLFSLASGTVKSPYIHFLFGVPPAPCNEDHFTTAFQFGERLIRARILPPLRGVSGGDTYPGVPLRSTPG